MVFNVIMTFLFLVGGVIGVTSEALAQGSDAPSIIESGHVEDGYQWSIGRATQSGPQRFQSIERTSEGMVMRTEATHDTIQEPTEAGRYREFLPYLFGQENFRILVPTAPLTGGPTATPSR